MNIMVSKPVKVFAYQEHEAHIRTHMAAAQDPLIAKLIKGSPLASTMQASLAAHIAEHVSFQYRREIEKAMGVPLPDSKTPLPEDIEVNYSMLVADAADKVLQKDRAQVQQQKQQQQQQDPIIQMQQHELQIKEAEVRRKGASDKARNELERERIQTNAAIRSAEIASEDERTGLEISTEVIKAREKLSAETERAKHRGEENLAREASNRESREMAEGTRLGVDIAKFQAETNRKG